MAKRDNEDLFAIEGSACLVTGASSGLGRAISVKLARAGARLALHGRDLEGLSATAALTGGIMLSADLTDPGAPEQLALETERLLGPLDVLVNNAGVGWKGPVAQMDRSDIERLLMLNLHAPIGLSRAVLPGMLERKRGALVFVGSLAGFLPVREEAVYSATKAGTRAFSEALRGETARCGVDVAYIGPAAVRTPFFERRGRPYGRRFPRMLDPDVVADLVLLALRYRRAEIIVPRWLTMVVWLQALAPGLFRGMVDRWA